jgi:hypothetical protein
VVTVEYDEQPSLLLLMLLLGRRLLLMVENTLSSNKYEDPSAHCFCCLCLLLLCFCVDVQCASVFIFVSVSVPLSYQYQPPTYLLRYAMIGRVDRYSMVPYLHTSWPPARQLYLHYFWPWSC